MFFFLFYPVCTTNNDETGYLLQAQAFAEGRRGQINTDPITGESKEEPPDRYAPGTALVMAPLISLFGWRGAYLLPFFSLVGAALLLAKWLTEERRSPLWTMLLLSYPSVVVLGRVATSDLPSLFLVILALFLFWRGENRHWRWWLGAGLIASISLLFRETNALLFLFFFLGALVRRNPGVGALVIGGLVGLAVFFSAEYWVYGNFFQRSEEIRLFGISNIWENLPYYAITLLGLLPGGLAAGLLYRGKRRPELVLTVIVYTLFFLMWNSAVAGGLINKLVLHAPRFSLGVVPILILALAEAGPRWVESVAAFVSEQRRSLFFRGLRLAISAWIAGTLMMAAAVHPFFARWSESRLLIIRAIEAKTAPGSVLVTNSLGTSKFIHPLYMDRIPLSHIEITLEDIRHILNNHYPVFLVLLYRTDSKFWQEMGTHYDQFVEDLSREFKLEKIFEQSFTPVETLRIWTIKLPSEN